MTMKNMIFQGFLATLLSTTALAQSAQQPADSLEHDNATKHKPSMIILTGDLLQGRIGPDAQYILESVETINTGFSRNGFSVTNIGDGSQRPVKYQAKLDSALHVMENDEAYYMFVSAHGGTQSYMHTVEMGTPPQNAKGQDKLHSLYTGDIVESPLNKSLDTQKPLRLGLLSCESDMFLLRLANTVNLDPRKIPEKSQFFTCSQGGDVSFDGPSEVIAREIQLYPDHTMTDLLDYFHKYNEFLFDDTNSKNKYNNGMSGGSLAIAERNEKGDIVVNVLCPRRSIKERIGTGLSEADSVTITENWMKYEWNPFVTPDLERIQEKIKNVNEYLKNSESMNGMSIVKQWESLNVLSYLHQKYELGDHADYLINEKNENTPKPASPGKSRPLFPPHIPH